MNKDHEAIKALGGPTKVAKEFGYGVQQVSNWMTRGIPAGEILDNRDFAKALAGAGYERVLQNITRRKAA